MGDLGFGLANVLWEARKAPGFVLEPGVFGDRLEAVQAGPHAALAAEILEGARQITDQPTD